MHPVKTYQQVNRNDSQLSFGISRMEDIYDRRGGVIDEAHRHAFYTVLLIDQAAGKHIIDFTEYDLGPNQIYFIGPGQVHQVFEEQRSVGFSIVFSNEFLAQNNIPVSFIEDLNLFHDFGQSPPLELDPDERQVLCRYAEEMFELNASDLTFKQAALGSLLQLLLIRCNNLCSLPEQAPHILEAGGTTLRGFKTLVNEHYATWHATADYARELHITPDHLNRVVKSLTGKTAKEHIQSRIITAAKRLIYFTDLTNKEIGYELGFSEPSNFSAFFKKCTGLSPSAFKSKA